MMKIFYSFLFVCFFASSFCFCEDAITISERTREELYIIIDESINPDDFKLYDLYKVYENMIEQDGKPYYTGYIDTIYVKKITSEKIIFNYVWQEEWRNIEKGYYIFPTGMKYMGKKEEIQSIITTGKTTPTSDSDSRKDGPAFSLISLTGAGLLAMDDVTNIKGMVMETDMLLTLLGWFGVRLCFVMDTTFMFMDTMFINYAIEFHVELSLMIKQLRLYCFTGLFPFDVTDSKESCRGVGGGWFFSLFSASGRKDCCLEFSIKKTYHSIISAIKELQFCIKFGYCIF